MWEPIKGFVDKSGDLLGSRSERNYTSEMENDTFHRWELWVIDSEDEMIVNRCGDGGGVHLCPYVSTPSQTPASD